MDASTEIVLTIIGAASCVFLAATMIGLGLQLGLRLGAELFGAIKVTAIQHQYIHSEPAPSKEGE